MKSLREFVFERERFVVGHRGSGGTAPENTLASFREAILEGADMVESDIQFTLDKQVVSFHDRFLERTSNGTGNIADLNYEQIYKLDAGSWFNSLFFGERIPLLGEVIDTIKDKAYLNIEIKGNKHSGNCNSIKKILDEIQLKNFRENTLISSFDYASLKLVKEYDNNIPIASIRNRGDKRLPSQLAAEIGCEAFVCSLDEINDEVSEDAYKNNIFIGVYSVDTSEQLEKVLKYKIKAIVTNFPGKIINELIKSGNLK